MTGKISQKQLDAATRDMFATEIADLERKRVATQEIIRLIEQIEPLHSEIVERRDELIELGISRARLIKMLDLSPLGEKVIRAKPKDLVRKSRAQEDAAKDENHVLVSQD